MFFEYIKFSNYRPYYGVQQLDFRERLQKSTTIHKKNIVLIGGLNGHGKTSLINAINVCFFGRRKFKAKDYEELLRNAVNRKHLAEGGKEGYVELAFSDHTGIYAIQVIFKHGTNRETRRIFQLDNNLNKVREIVTSEQDFNEFIDQRIPLDVSQFFIFDAEKIRELVGEQDSSETVRAIQKIVSLELYKQLLKDLDHITSEFSRDYKKQVNDNEMKELVNNAEKISNDLEKHKSKEREITEKINILTEEVIRLQQQRRIIIANASATKQQLNKWIGEYEEKINNLRNQIKKFKEKELHNIILFPAIMKLKTRIKMEKEYLEFKYREEMKFAPYEQFIEKLLAKSIFPPLLKNQKKQLRNQGKIIWAELNNIQEAVGNEITVIHDLSNKDYHFILQYPNIKGNDVYETLDKLRKSEGILKKYIDQLENAPDEIDTKELDEEIKKKQELLGELRQKKKTSFSLARKLQDDLQKIKREITEKQKIVEVMGPIKEKLHLAYKLRNATEEFIEKVTLSKARQLKNQIEVIMQQMFRKSDFAEVKFHPERFSLSIYDEFGKEIDLMSRSEGEKQLIALAMIWALTKVSGKDIPFVIDTPLARLDGIHRSNLIHHYFTKLSDQVIILSTDTEITSDFYDELKPFLQKAYILNYNDEEQYTTIEEGYFFERIDDPWLK